MTCDVTTNRNKWFQLVIPQKGAPPTSFRPLVLEGLVCLSITEHLSRVPVWDASYWLDVVICCALSCRPSSKLFQIVPNCSLPSLSPFFFVPPSSSSSCVPLMCPAAGSVRCCLLHYKYLYFCILFHIMLSPIRASLTAKDKRWFLSVIEGQLWVWMLKRTMRWP